MSVIPALGGWKQEGQFQSSLWLLKQVEGLPGICETLPQTNKQASMPTDSSGTDPQRFFLHHLESLSIQLRLESPGQMTGAVVGVCYDMDMNSSYGKI